MQLLRQILWQRQKKRQLLIAGSGLALGLAFIMLALQLFVSTQQTVSKRGPDSKYEYLILNKPVSGLNSLSMLNKRFGAAFKPYEIEELAAQPFIHDVAPFTTNQFAISSNLQEEMGMYADLFFESVPDAFMDTLPPEWGWSAGASFVPVVMTKDWLDIYNFNVAMMYDLPQLSEETVKEMNFKLRISGKGKSETFSSRLVAFSYRLPSLMIPLSFMEWANAKYGEEEGRTQKVILATPDAAAPALTTYLEEKGYETNTEKTGRQSFRAIAQATATLIGIIGGLFTLLSVVVVTVTLQLLISRAREELTLMLTLGYDPKMVEQAMLRQSLRLLLPSALIGLALFVGAAFALHQWVGQQQLLQGPVVNGYALAGGILVVVLTFLLARKSIRAALQQQTR